MEKLPIELDVWYSLSTERAAFMIESSINGYFLSNQKNEYIGKVVFKTTGFEVFTYHHCDILMKGFVKYKDIKKITRK